MKLAAMAAFLAASLGTLAAGPLPTPRFADPARRAKFAPAFPKVEKIFEDFRRRHGVPGLVFGIVIDGDLALVKASGVRDRTSDEPVTPETVFRIASMTKSFTAAAILKLRDEDRLSLDDPVAKWIPESGSFVYPTRDSAPIRIRHLLTHSAGFPEDNPWGDRQLAVSEQSLTGWLEQGLPFSTPPGTRFEYSNYGFALLGRIVSRASRMPYRDYLEKQILAPLGMRDSTLEPAAVPDSRRARGYRKSGEQYSEVPPLADGAFGAMGGLLTSARDLARYISFQLSAYPPRDEEDRGPVRRSSLREMQQLWRAGTFTAARPSPGAPLRFVSGGYGYGLSVSRNCRFEHIVAHGGGLPGFGSYMLWLPEHGVGIFAMANLTYAAPVPAIEETLDALLETGALRPRELPPSPALVSMREAIVRLWRDWNERDANAVAADNLFQDSPAAERRREIEEIKSELGDCRPSGPVRPRNLLRGAFRMTCERGAVDVRFTLAPTMPPRLQYLAFAPAAAPSETLKAIAASLAASIADPSEERVSPLRAASLDFPAIRRDMEALRGAYGACRVGETVSGDGKRSARLRFACDRGPLDVSLRLNDEGKLSEATFHRPADVACVP